MDVCTDWVGVVPAGTVTVVKAHARFSSSSRQQLMQFTDGIFIVARQTGGGVLSRNMGCYSTPCTSLEPPLNITALQLTSIQNGSLNIATSPFNSPDGAGCWHSVYCRLYIGYALCVDHSWGPGGDTHTWPTSNIVVFAIATVVLILFEHLPSSVTIA